MKKITLFNQEYHLEKEEGNAFNMEEVEDLVTDYFEPYDYILGDYAYGKLRLKGFYENANPKATKINKISGLEEYIREYCAYKCRYFLLKKLKIEKN